MSHIVVVIGTRPEAIKMAPVVRELRRQPWAQCTVLLSGQHRALLDQTLDTFGIVADQDLDLMAPDQSLGALTGKAFLGFDKAFREWRPDLVLAQGDTTTAMVAAMSCFYQNIAFAHVEAGLRTGDIRNPFPEELNRIVAGLVAQLHFAPTQKAAAALAQQGVAPGNIFLTGNTVIDNLAHHAAQLSHAANLDQKRLILLTSHRRENFGEPMRSALLAVRDVVEAHPDVRVLYPVHPNPNVERVAHEVLGAHPRVTLTGPLDYFAFIATLSSAHVVVTDSGGVQEEAPFFSKPVLVLRDATERPEAVEAGVAELVGLNREHVRTRLGALLDDPQFYARMARPCSPYGDGLASKRIAERIGIYLGHARIALIPPFGA